MSDNKTNEPNKNQNNQPEPPKPEKPPINKLRPSASDPKRFRRGDSADFGEGDNLSNFSER